MKQAMKQMVMAILMGLLMPGVLLSAAILLMNRENEAQLVTAVTQTLLQTTVPATENYSQQQLEIPVLMDDGSVRTMELNDYLTGVLLAEIPVSFESEAQKAQAVVARTYVLKRYLTQYKHENGAVCTDSSCCQGYLSEEDYLEKGGNQEGIDRMRMAVEQTWDQVLTFENALIDATYFSCSGGNTEDALAVWGVDIPYLQSTSSPGEESAAHYSDTVSFSTTEFQNLLQAELSDDPQGWFGAVTYTTGGGVATMEIGGTVYQGTQLRQLLGLRSTDFSVTVSDSQIVIQTHGYGHRVGMSQYGADAMAVSGNDYTQILAHYYLGTTLTSWRSVLD